MKRIAGLLTLLVTYNGYTQDIGFARKIVDTLTSSAFWGRGYTNDGMSKAASFLAGQFQSYGLRPLKGNDFFQSFSYPVNTFPGKMEGNINGKERIAFSLLTGKAGSL